MNPRVINVQAKPDYTLLLEFENKEIRTFDTTPFLDKGIFIELRDPNYFSQAKVVFGAVEWPHEQDFSKDTLYLMSKPVNS